MESALSARIRAEHQGEGKLLSMATMSRLRMTRIITYERHDKQEADNPADGAEPND